MLKNNNYYVICAWMINDLKLKGNELHLYAIIYGFCQSGGEYTGNRQYLADWLGLAKKDNVDKYLKSLIDKKLIEKHITTRPDNTKQITYTIIQNDDTLLHYDWLNN